MNDYIKNTKDNESFLNQQISFQEKKIKQMQIETDSMCAKFKEKDNLIQDLTT